MKFEDLLYLLSVTKDKKAQSIIIKQLHYLDDTDAKELAKLEYNAIPDFDELFELVMSIRDGEKTADEVISWGFEREQYIQDHLDDVVKYCL